MNGLNKIRETVAKFLFNQQNLVLFYVFGVMYIILPLQAYGHAPVQRMFQNIYIVWTLLILLHSFITRSFKFDGILTVLALFFFWACLTYLVQPKAHGIVPAKHLMTLLAMSAVFFPLSKSCGADEFESLLKRVGKLIICSTVLFSIVSILYFYLAQAVQFPDAIAEYFIYSGGRPDGGTRYSGLFYHPVMAGEKCFLSMMFSLYLLKRKEMPAWAFVLTFVCSIWMMYLGDPRTNYVQIGIVLLYALYKIVRSKIGTKNTVIVFAGIMGAGFIMALAKFLTSDFSSINVISSNRMIIWSTAFQEFLKRPLFGWGWENGDAIAQFTNENIYNCHNIFMNLLLWTGIPGIILFICFLYIVFKRFVNISKHQETRLLDWMAITVIALVVQSCLDILILGEDVRAGTPVFWLLSGYLYYTLAESVQTDELTGKDGTIWTFEYFRSYFLICVMFTHLIFLVEPYNDPISSAMDFGVAGVYFFFIISSFFLCRTLKKHEPQSWDAAVRLILKRTMPYLVLYWIRLVLVLAYNLILYYYSGIHLSSVPEMFAKFVLDLLMVDIYVPQIAPDIGWYLRALMFCYLMAYPMFRFVRSCDRRKRFVITCVCIVLYFVLNHIALGSEYETWIIYYNPYVHLIDLFIGMSISCDLFDRDSGNYDKNIFTALEIGAVVLIAVVQFIMPQHMDYLFRYKYVVYLTVMSILVFIFSKQAGLLSEKGGNHKLLAWFHRHFFSLYIFHDIIIKYSMMVPWSSSKYLNLLGAVIVILILDEVLFLPVSRPLSRVLNSRIQKQRSQAE